MLQARWQLLLRVSLHGLGFKGRAHLCVIRCSVQRLGVDAYEYYMRFKL